MRGQKVTSRALESSIQEMHRFVKDSYESFHPPAFRAIVFDEAQRAWSRERNLNKFSRDISEPDMILQIMGRHKGWAVVIGLIGGGQEIHSGEAGLTAWGEALASHPEWKLVSSPQTVTASDLIAGGTLFDESNTIDPTRITIDDRLHLNVSKRSYDAENNSRWVNAVLEGRPLDARACTGDNFPVFLSRSLEESRTWLMNAVSPNRRSGLIASSGATRLRAEGIEPPTFKFLSGIDYPAWFLKPAGDVRSSNQLEVAMSEFELQGLELDNVGLLGGGDLIFLENKPVIRKFRGTAWHVVNAPSEHKEAEQPFHKGTLNMRELTLNKYRVLMTRYRKKMLIFVPRGVMTDQTRLAEEYDMVANYLISCGARPLTT